MWECLYYLPINYKKNIFIFIMTNKRKFYTNRKDKELGLKGKLLNKNLGFSSMILDHPILYFFKIVNYSTLN